MLKSILILVCSQVWSVWFHFLSTINVTLALLEIFQKLKTLLLPDTPQREQVPSLCEAYDTDVTYPSVSIDSCDQQNLDPYALWISALSYGYNFITPGLSSRTRVRANFKIPLLSQLFYSSSFRRLPPHPPYSFPSSHFLLCPVYVIWLQLFSNA